MTASTNSFWVQFDDLERQRKAAHALHARAFRQLDVAVRDLHHEPSRVAWKNYCEGVRLLEACVSDLERLLWKLKR